MIAARLMTAMAPSVAATAVRMLAATLRVEVRGVERVMALWRQSRPLIYIIWHGRILLAPWANQWLRRTREARAVAVLASRSRDGELVSRYVDKFGLRVVRGSSSRGGAAGLRELATALREGTDVALVPDGPRGPRGQLQPGVVALAALTGAPVVPLGFGARPARRLNSWDGFVIPLPFARCAVVFGDPIPVTRDADRAQAGKELERALDEASALADRLVAS
jgi:lysophospholipid acyltransferase (LPLAT)-like uncharacterized protein